MTYESGARVKFDYPAGKTLAGNVEGIGELGTYAVRLDDGRLFFVPVAHLQPADAVPAPLTRGQAAAIIDRTAAEAIRAGAECPFVFAERDAARGDLAHGTTPPLVIARLIDGVYRPHPQG